jgi:hypothetical protein
MEPIYIQTHKLDPNQLARWTFRASLKRLIPFYLVIGLSTGEGLFGILGLDWRVGLGIGIFSTIAMLVGFRYRLVKLYKKPGSNQLLVPRHLVLDEKKYELAYQNGVISIVPWDVIRKMQVTEDFVVLYTPFGPHILLKSVMTQQAMQLVESKVGQPKNVIG